MTERTSLLASHEPLAERYDVALLDLDGVVYVGPSAVEGARELGFSDLGELWRAGVVVPHVPLAGARGRRAADKIGVRVGQRHQRHDLVQVEADVVQALPPGVAALARLRPPAGREVARLGDVEVADGLSKPARTDPCLNSAVDVRVLPAEGPLRDRC